MLSHVCKYPHGCDLPVITLFSFLKKTMVPIAHTPFSSSWGCRQTRASDQKLACTSSFAATTTTEISSYEIGSSGSSIKTAAITTVISAGEIAYAYGIIVRRASDDPTWPTRDNAAARTSGNTGTATSTSTTSSAAAASDEDSSSSGLSTGAKAGIGVGASIGGLLILAACAGGFLMLRRRRRRRAHPTAQLGVDETPRELHAESVQELPAGDREGWKRERATELSST